jgi:hypothetical protein
VTWLYAVTRDPADQRSADLVLRTFDEARKYAALG